MTPDVHRGVVFGAGALLFSIVSYGVFLAVFLYLLAFLANLQLMPLAESWPILRVLVPVSIDLGRDMGSMASAFAVDIGLLLLFGLQHSLMARPGFKRAWTRIVPREIERSVYVLFSSVVLAVLMWQWRPIPSPVLWHSGTTWGVASGWAVMGVGVIVLLWATFLIDRIVRHPLYVGWLLIFWGAATMTAGHLLFSTIMSGYILIALRFEEWDLVRYFGEPYRRYREEVPALLPRLGRRFSG